MSEEKKQGGGLQPARELTPGDEVEPGTQGAAEDVRPECGGSVRLDNGERCPNCNGMGVVIRVSVAAKPRRL